MIPNKPVGGVQFHNLTSDDEIFGNVSSSDTEFTATISGFGGADIIIYNVVSGNEDSIVPRLVTGTEIGHLRLYNATRGLYALIESVNTAANQITLTAALPGSWQVGDTITTDSPTVISPWGFKYYEIDCSGFLSADVVAALIYATYLDNAAIGGRLVLHPYETEADGKRQAYRLQAVNAQFNFTTIIKIVDQKFCFCADFSGAGTGIILFRIVGYWE
jgi:hypothetical protein